MRINTEDEVKKLKGKVDKEVRKTRNKIEERIEENEERFKNGLLLTLIVLIIWDFIVEYFDEK